MQLMVKWSSANGEVEFTPYRTEHYAVRFGVVATLRQTTATGGTMKAADLRLGPDRKHFEGVVVVDVKASSPVVIRRLPESDVYRMTVLDERKPNMSTENQSAFIPQWILRADGESPPIQKDLFEANE